MNIQTVQQKAFALYQKASAKKLLKVTGELQSIGALMPSSAKPSAIGVFNGLVNYFDSRVDRIPQHLSEETFLNDLREAKQAMGLFINQMEAFEKAGKENKLKGAKKKQLDALVSQMNNEYARLQSGKAMLSTTQLVSLNRQLAANLKNLYGIDSPQGFENRQERLARANGAFPKPQANKSSFKKGLFNFLGSLFALLSGDPKSANFQKEATSLLGNVLKGIVGLLSSVFGNLFGIEGKKLGNMAKAAFSGVSPQPSAPKSAPKASKGKAASFSFPFNPSFVPGFGSFKQAATSRVKPTSFFAAPVPGQRSKGKNKAK